MLRGGISGTARRELMEEDRKRREAERRERQDERERQKELDGIKLQVRAREGGG